MSYCRFSSDGFQSDVYVYESCHGGFTTYVAARRRAKRIPDIDWTSDETIRASIAAQREALDDPDNVFIDLNLGADGAMFNDPSAKDCADRLIWLREKGYRIPQFAIDALREEGEIRSTQ